MSWSTPKECNEIRANIAGKEGKKRCLLFFASVRLLSSDLFRWRMMFRSALGSVRSFPSGDPPGGGRSQGPCLVLSLGRGSLAVANKSFHSVLDVRHELRGSSRWLSASRNYYHHSALTKIHFCCRFAFSPPTASALPRPQLTSDFNACA